MAGLVRILKRAGLALAALLLLAVAYVYGRSEYMIRRHFDVALEPLPVRHDSATIARGAHVVRLRGCPTCHGHDLGGSLLFEQSGVARLYAPNLTTGQGGRAASYSDAELARAIRHGVRQDARGVFAMPAPTFYYLNDPDLEGVLAYLRSIPPVDRTTPPIAIGPLGRLGLVLGKYRQETAAVDHNAPRLAVTDPDSTSLYGEYLARSICSECHGMSLEGGAMGDGTPTPGLAVVAGYTYEGFGRAIREGKALDGRQLRPQMPIQNLQALTDVEQRALYAFLTTRTPATGK